ncbi:MAG: glutamate racemase [Nitrospira sp.]|nr:glutamate racemase [Nitrospira sp.]
MKNNKRPIGVFDSGIGGLTVLKEIIKLLPEEDTVYLGDTAHLPYGTKSEETVIKYSIDNTRFLLKYDIKLLVVACNTASAVSLNALRQEFTLPMIGVIDAGARAAVKATKNCKVGIIGTDTTIRSSAYTKAMKAINPDIETIAKPCPLFVPIVEEGWTDDEIAVKVAERYLHPLKEEGIDTLVLGCTHYPLLKKAIRTVMGDGVRLIDSAEETALEVRAVLQADMVNRVPDGATPVRRFFVTDVSPRFEEQGSRFLDMKIPKVEKINWG